MVRDNSQELPSEPLVFNIWMLIEVTKVSIFVLAVSLIHYLNSKVDLVLGTEFYSILSLITCFVTQKGSVSCVIACPVFYFLSYQFLSLRLQAFEFSLPPPLTPSCPALWLPLPLEDESSLLRDGDERYCSI